MAQEYTSKLLGGEDEEIFRKGLFIVPEIEIYNPLLGQYAINIDLVNKLMLFSVEVLQKNTCLYFQTEVSKAPRYYARVYALATKPGTTTTIKLSGKTIDNINFGPRLCMICKEDDNSVTLEPIKGVHGNGEEFSINIFENIVGNSEAYSINFNSNNCH
ncbi:hypothetical protein [Endozoicomonas numazuensis]|uniref:Uncharacterized protein n=1 Tax=Endozoicomonas numazuensis TaxID=1137799 RepID=A0A081NHJ4_9GAMM|nr:hypothetical protein [Endozoicomonas numazuensis]KEQ17917.1 hypothetical protein GZ78_09805 [Endozoicomonas numazuensis]